MFLSKSILHNQFTQNQLFIKHNQTYIGIKKLYQKK